MCGGGRREDGGGSGGGGGGGGEGRSGEGTYRLMLGIGTVLTGCHPPLPSETGATTLPPESFRFPTSISSLSSSTWVFNGESVWKDGKRISNSYGSQSLESLGEGSTVGLLRSAGSLHLYINGVDQGAAEQSLPSHVYPIVDLYGRCAQVSIVQPGEFLWQQLYFQFTTICISG